MGLLKSTVDPWFLDVCIGPNEAKQAMTSAFHTAPSATGLVPEGGVLPGLGSSGLGVTATTPTPSMAINVFQGQCVIPRAGRGGYVATWPTATNVTVDAASASNPRIDVVCAVVRDDGVPDATNGTYAKGFGIEIVKGSPSAIPVPNSTALAALPDYLPLAQVLVPANATSVTSGNITDLRWFTRTAGGIRNSYNDSGRPQGVAGSMPWEVRVDTLGVYTQWNPTSSTWVSLPSAKVALGASVNAGFTDLGTVTSTVYIATRAGTANTVTGLAFVAPQSGSVMVHWSAGLYNTVAGFFCLVGIELRQGAVVGSGTVVTSAADTNALQVTATTETKISDFQLLTGLTPGSSYNVRHMYRTLGNTMNVHAPKIVVVPTFA